MIGGALDVFWRQGYSATSMRDLKEELGILPGSLYAAYGDKHALFLRALERYTVGAANQADALAEGPVLAHLRELLLSVLEAARETPGRGCLLGNTAAELLPADEAAGKIVHSGFEALEAGITQGLEAAQRSGEIRADVDCGTQARLLLVVMQGLHVVARAEAEPRRLTDAVDAALAPLTAK
ncbi:TetR/AcrR family transcriptional regulator [Amycolatopsis sp. WAC 01416]|uniref:TetR/AcrR family transcriptional regulator n=1 Tax=Amycolatopsis sp. WAC 01416 TaxID=2203196 RepID=UPI0018F587A1|nr:TetR/AcrR family transcriptional regulator [Amycolatopsis sp. WAC 01416]